MQLLKLGACERRAHASAVGMLSRVRRGSAREESHGVIRWVKLGGCEEEGPCASIRRFRLL